MKKKLIVLSSICIVFTMLFFVSCSENEALVSNRDNLKTELVTRMHVGISVEKDSINGVYLRFASEGVLTRFVDSLWILDDDQANQVISSFVEKGFVPRGEYEKASNVLSGDKYPDWAWSYIINQNKYFKVGDTLYQDENQIKLYKVLDDGQKILLKDRSNRTSSMLKASSTCKSGGKISGSFGAYPAGTSGMNTLVLDSYIEHYIPFLGDQKLILYSSLAMRQPDKYLVSATGTLSHYFSYDIYTASGSDVVSGRTRTSSAGVSSFKTVLAQSQFLCIGYVYVTFKGVRSDGRSVQGKIRMEP